MANFTKRYTCAQKVAQLDFVIAQYARLCLGECLHGKGNAGERVLFNVQQHGQALTLPAAKFCSGFSSSTRSLNLEAAEASNSQSLQVDAHHHAIVVCSRTTHP